MTDPGGGVRIATRTCPLCEATCGLSIQLRGQHVERISGDTQDVFSHGYMCPKGASLGELHDDPDWLRKPVIKIDGRFVEVDWDTAFARVAELFAPFRAPQGPAVTATFIGNPAAHNLGSGQYHRVVTKALASRHFYSSATVDHRPKELVNALLYGVPRTLAVPDIDRTDLIVLVGANPYESNGSLATAPGWPRRLRAVQERGGQVVVIDPVRTRTAESADWHLRPRVGSDAALLFSLVHVLFDEDLVDLGAVAPYIRGLDGVRAAASSFDPTHTASFTGVDPAEVRALARQLSDARTACVYGRMGTTATEFGSIASWLIDVLNILTGNLDRAGGSMFPLPAAGSSNTRGTPRFGRGVGPPGFHTRVRRAPEIFGELPVGCLAEEILEPGDGQYRAMVIISGNPVVSGPRSERMSEALSSLDALVAVDPYINDTTRHADVILPPPSLLQRSHYDTLFYTWAVRNVANYSPPILPLRPGQLDEWEIMCRLASALDGSGRTIEEVDDELAAMMIRERQQDANDPLYGRGVEDVLRSLEPRRGPERLVDLMLRSGPYGEWSHEQGGLSLAVLEQNPHGVDLGPLQSRMPDVLRTPDGMVDIAPRMLIDDVDRLVQALDRRRGSALRLIGRRHLRSNNSWLHNVPSLMSGKNRATLRINPQDADALGVDDGQTVKLSSNVATVHVVAEVTDRMPPGACSLPHGWLHDANGVELSVARLRPGVNTNRLTPDDRFDVPSWTSVLNGIEVVVEPC